MFLGGRHRTPRGGTPHHGRTTTQAPGGHRRQRVRRVGVSGPTTRRCRVSRVGPVLPRIDARAARGDRRVAARLPRCRAAPRPGRPPARGGRAPTASLAGERSRALASSPPPIASDRRAPPFRDSGRPPGEFPSPLKRHEEQSDREGHLVSPSGAPLTSRPGFPDRLKASFSPDPRGAPPFRSRCARSRRPSPCPPSGRRASSSWATRAPRSAARARASPRSTSTP